VYQQLFTRLALSSSTTSEVSLPAAMQGANAAQIDVVILSLAGTSPTARCSCRRATTWRTGPTREAPVGRSTRRATLWSPR
jgi:hypothetical protein